jgi:hypothetical protein
VAVVKDLIEVTSSPPLVPPLLVLLVKRVRAVVAIDGGAPLQCEELQPKLGEGVTALDDKQL